MQPVAAGLVLKTDQDLQTIPQKHVVYNYRYGSHPQAITKGHSHRPEFVCMSYALTATINVKFGQNVYDIWQKHVTIMAGSLSRLFEIGDGF